ncbi:MAG: HPP family protein [Candidatus Bathyarchaeia archaeon]
MKLPLGTPIARLMDKEPIAVYANSKLKTIVRKFKSTGMDGFPVIDRRGKLIGFICITDLLRACKRRERVGSDFGRFVPEFSKVLSTERVSDVMTERVAAIDLDSTVAEAVRLMLEHGVSRLPVIDKEGKLVGTLTDREILSVVASCLER